MTKKFFLILALIIMFFVNGCWDRREIESLAFVQALGLDLGKNGEGLTVTTMIAIPTQLAGGQPGGGGGGTETGTFLITMDAPTIYEAFNLINTTVNREVTLLQNSLILIGEDLARHGLSKWIDNLVRFREMRRTIQIMICQGKTSDIMKVKPALEKNPSEYFSDLLHLSNRTGMFPPATFNDFLSRYEAYSQENYLPLIAKYKPQNGEAAQEEPAKSQPTAGGGSGKAAESEANPPEEVRLVGTAIFRGDKMVGSFDIYQTQILLLLTGEFREAFLTIPDPKKKEHFIVFRLLATAKPKIKYKNQGGQNHFEIKLNLEADIVSIQSGIDYTNPKMEAYLGAKIAGALQKRVSEVINQAQQQFNADVFGFGAKVRDTFITSAEWDRYRWPEKFNQASINTRVKVNLRRVGVQFNPPHER